MFNILCIIVWAVSIITTKGYYLQVENGLILSELIIFNTFSILRHILQVFHEIHFYIYIKRPNVILVDKNEWISIH